VDAQQTGKIPRIGILANVPAPQIDALEQTLRDAGYVEGQNIITEKRYAEGRLERFPDLAAELVHLKVNVIVSIGPATPYAAKSIKDIPVVMGYSGDPVDAGIVASLARPGGNVTGVTFFAAELAGKRVELLRRPFRGSLGWQYWPTRGMPANNGN
jgi:putative tryptophan/tyrosine transport system substrate-binding protein